MTFGDGEHGARLPTGVENVRAVYRSGIGAPGNVQRRADQPAGDPAAGRQGGDQSAARVRAAPTAKIATWRAKTRRSRCWRSIAWSRCRTTPTSRAPSPASRKAVAARTSDGAHELVFLTIAGATTSRSTPLPISIAICLAALRKLGDPDLPLRVDLRELRVADAVGASIALLPDYMGSGGGHGASAIAGLLRLRPPCARTAASTGRAHRGDPGRARGGLCRRRRLRRRSPRRRRPTDGTRRLSRWERSRARCSTRSEVGTAVLERRRPRPHGLPPDVRAFAGGRDDHGAIRPAQLALFTAARGAVPDRH